MAKRGRSGKGGKAKSHRRNDDSPPEAAIAVADDEVELIVPALLDAEPPPVIASNPRTRRNEEAWGFFPIDAEAWNRYGQTRFTRRNPAVSDIPFAKLRTEIEEVRERINRMRLALHRFFVKREELIDLMCTCAAAQEPFLLVGLPGTGKSDLVVKFVEALGLGDGQFFEYMLTKFTEPSEIIGPLDISQLKDGKYIRRTKGKVAEAEIAFIDEVFRGSSAILNTLLTVMNERKIFQDGRAEKIPLKMLFAATNRIPELEELEAVRDRFAIKAETGSVKDEFFDDLIEKGLQGDLDKALNKKPWANLGASLEDFVKVRRYMDLLMAGEGEGSGSEAGRIERDRKRFFPEALYRDFQDLIRAVEREAKVYVSDRKVIRLYRLIRTHAFLLHGGEVRKGDLRLLRYIGDRSEDLARVRDVVDSYLKL